MKTLITALLLLSSINGFANSIDKEIKQLANAVNLGTNGGDASISTYNVIKFDYKPLVKEVFGDIKNSHCAYTTIIGVRELSKIYRYTNIFNDRNSSEAQDMLVKLLNKKNIKAAIGYYWNGENGSSEYCLTEKLDLYFTNGQVLSIYFNETT